MERGPGEVLGVRGRSLESCWFLLEKKKTSSGMVTADLLMFLAVTSLPYLLLMFGYSFAWGG